MGNEKPTLIDLFCGCGGFSLGMERAGFHTLAAIDSDSIAIEVFKENFPHVQHVLKKNLTRYKPSQLAGLIGTNHVDLIIGGPPCQGFSHVRQGDGSNHGERLVKDSRRSLYRQYLNYVEFFQPKYFIMENVPGIRSADNGKYFTALRLKARNLGYRVSIEVVHASDFCVPQKRKRQLIIGTRMDIKNQFHKGLLVPTSKGKKYTLGEAIGDLPRLRAGKGSQESCYDRNLREKHIARYGRRYLYKILEIEKAKKLTSHFARPHSERDLRDFARLPEGINSAQAIKQGIEFEFPYSKESFKDRYTRQHRNKLCSTILAHLSKDGLMFIHPTQNRSLTPREAARIQSFPDWFRFSVKRTHQYRLIGNAVPPLVAKAVGQIIRKLTEEKISMKISMVKDKTKNVLPKNINEAAQRILLLVDASESKSLKNMDKETFLSGWRSCFYLLPGLHPDEATDHGKKLIKMKPHELNGIEHKLFTPYYERSGWPLALVPLADEAWKRYEKDKLTDQELYCYEAILKRLNIN